MPLLKTDKNSTAPDSYRGINLLPALGKIIDKAIYQQTLEYLNTKQLIPPQHHGGIKMKSTVTALNTILDSWTTEIEAGEDVAVILLDQSAAYDIIDHKLLLQKWK